MTNQIKSVGLDRVANVESRDNIDKILAFGPGPGDGRITSAALDEAESLGAGLPFSPVASKEPDTAIGGMQIIASKSNENSQKVLT